MSRYTDAYEEMFHPKKPAKNPNIWCYKCKNRNNSYTTCGSDLCLMEKHSQPCWACGNTKWGKGAELEIIICEDFEGYGKI